MSKSISGHFVFTKGHIQFMLKSRSASDIIKQRVKSANLDTHSHPTNYKILSSKQKKLLALKIAGRKITRAEYELYIKNIRLDKRRKIAIVEFWNEERKRIKNGVPTRVWSEEQIRDINNHARPKHRGKTIQAHHTYSVAKYPHLANRPETIYPVTPHEHLNGWHGGNYKKSRPGRPIKPINEF